MVYDRELLEAYATAAGENGSAPLPVMARGLKCLIGNRIELGPRGWLEIVETCGLFSTTTDNGVILVSLLPGITSPSKRTYSDEEILAAAYGSWLVDGKWANLAMATQAARLFAKNLPKTGSLLTVSSPFEEAGYRVHAHGKSRWVAPPDESLPPPDISSHPAAIRNKQAYDRLAIIPIEDVLPYVVLPEHAAMMNMNGINSRHPLWHEIMYRTYAGVEIRMDSQRYQTFATKGLVCSACGIKASHFAVERTARAKHNVWHLNLYGIDGTGNEVLFTKDHHIPRAKGGSNALSNFQTMCQPCNNIKGDAYPSASEVRRSEGV